jgi:hypothetical protein
VYFYNAYITEKIDRESVFDQGICELDSTFVSLEYFFEKILEEDTREEEITLNLMHVLNSSYMLGVRLRTLNESYDINFDCITLMDYYYDAVYEIICDYLNHQLSDEKLLDNIRIISKDMINLRGLVASTEILHVVDRMRLDY